MTRVNQILFCIIHKENGATSVEYAIIAFLIAATIALAVGVFGGNVNALFETVKFW